MRQSKFGAWRQALLGSLGLLSACGGQATNANDSSGAGGTTSGSDGDADIGATGSTTSGSGSATGTSRAATSGVTTGGGGTQTTGIAHRAERAQCDPFQPSNESAIPAEYRGEGGSAGSTERVERDFQCEFDSDCTDGFNGDCYFYNESTDRVYLGTRCSYGCQVDSDCAFGSVCECTGGNNRCVPANCATDADCGEGRLCLRTEYFDGCFDNPYYACQTPLDRCAQNADCADRECGFNVQDGLHACIEPSCVVGRPFLIYGAERRAGSSRRSDWRAEAAVDLTHLTQGERRALAARWETIASMEHASIAAFARFALQLLSVGAPAELLERTHAAMADETRHARVAYGIGSRYAGHDIGPAPLALDGALADQDFLALVVNTVLEGCIGETVAAAEAAWGSMHAQDRVLTDVLADIAADEAKHAELAFAFVHWAVRRDPRLAPVVLATVEQELVSLAPRAPALADGWLSRHGLLPDARRWELKREVLEEMTLPCLRAICAVERAA